jgi:hypothetical protein
MAQISISELSQSISELIDLDLHEQSLIVDAIDRALDARQIVGGRNAKNKGYNPTNCEVPVLINGTIAVPDNCVPYFPIGKIAAPTHGSSPQPPCPNRRGH